MGDTWTFHSAGELIFGRNASRQLREVASRLKVKRTLIVTDPVLEKTGLLSPIHGALKESGAAVEIFAGGEPEPSFRAAQECIDVARRFRCDTILGLGGG